MNLLLLGAIAMASLIISLFFLRFWKVTGDRFFLFFAISFFVEGINRAVLGLSNYSGETAPIIYFVRFLSFLIILVAIADKNRKRVKEPDPSEKDTMQ